MRETFEPVLLERKAIHMRKTTGNNQLQARTYDENLTFWQTCQTCDDTTN